MGTPAWAQARYSLGSSCRPGLSHCVFSHLQVCLVAGAGVASQVRAEVKRRRSLGGKQASSEGTQPKQSPERWASCQRLCMKPPAFTDSASCWSHRTSTYQAGLSLPSRLHTSSAMKIKEASEGPAVPSVTCSNSRSTCVYVSVHLSPGPASRRERGTDPALTRIK